METLLNSYKAVSINSTSGEGSGLIGDSSPKHWNPDLSDEVSINSTSGEGSGASEELAQQAQVEFPLIPLPVKEAVLHSNGWAHGDIKRFPLIPLPVKEAVCSN